MTLQRPLRKESGPTHYSSAMAHYNALLSGLLLGSETQKVLTHTDIPVIVYR